MKNVQTQHEEIERLVSMHITFSITLNYSKPKFKKLLQKLEKMLII